MVMSHQNHQAVASKAWAHIIEGTIQVSVSVTFANFNKILGKNTMTDMIVHLYRTWAKGAAPGVLLEGLQT